MEQSSPGQNPPPQNQQAPSNTTLMAILAYLGILIVIPFMMAKNDSFVKFHIKQGLVLVIAEIAVWILGAIFWQLWMLIQIVNLAALVLAIIGIVNVVNHKEAELPLVGSLAHSFKI